MDQQLPDLTAPCDGPGCKKEINLLENHLSILVKPKQQVLLAEAIPASGKEEIPQSRLYLGDRTGRGVVRIFHDFSCASSWFSKRKDYTVKLQPHHEPEIYVPEDNRSTEELVKAGELPKEVLAYHDALAKMQEAGGEEG